MLRPFFIVIAAHDINRCYLLKAVNDILPVDITTMKNHVTILERSKDFLPEQTVSVRKNSDCIHLHAHSLPSLRNSAFPFLYEAMTGELQVSASK